MARAAEQSGDDLYHAYALNGLSYLACEEGRLKDAVTYLRSADERRRETKMPPPIWALYCAGEVWIRVGEVERASAALGELSSRVTTPSHRVMAYLLRSLVAGAQGQEEVARENMDAAVALHSEGAAARANPYMSNADGLLGELLAQRTV